MLWSPLTFTLERMNIVERFVSADGQLVLAVAIEGNGDMVVGFEGGEWHTHPDLLAHWLSVPEEQAVHRFVEMLQSDQLPIVMSTDGGLTPDPWVSDNLEQTLSLYGRSNCVLRYWSGTSVQGENAL